MMPFTDLQDAGEAEDKVRIRKSTLKRIISEATRSLNENHPYDKLIKISMRYDFSDSDAVGHIENDIMSVDRAGLSPKAIEALEELVGSVEGGYNDDAEDLMEYIPKEIKDRFALAPLKPQSGYDEDDEDSDYDYY